MAWCLTPCYKTRISEPLEIISSDSGSPPSPRDRRRATLALLIACAGWGGSFTWAKVIMTAINRGGGLDESATLGVLVLLSWRFLLTGVIWMMIFPAARSGWSRASFYRATLLSLPFVLGMIIQQMSLTRTSPAVNAFLTSLNVLFVPMIVACITRRLPTPALLISILLAVAGIWMLSNPGRTGFGVGEILGVVCSVLFSVHIVLINTLLKRDTPARMVGGQMIITGAAVFIVALALEPQARAPRVLLLPFAGSVLPSFAMLVAVSSLLAFGLMIFFQPKVEPTRAALIYLTEPVFAGAYAWIFAGDALTLQQIAGAGLIIAANSLVEWLTARRIHDSAVPVGEVA
jgi:drug/metabolite transporter (DMT)-like permease